MPIPDYTLVALLACCGLAAAISRNLWATAVLLGTYSFILAILWGLWGGPDVAFTEAAVGGGVSTLFFIALLWHTTHQVQGSALDAWDIGLGILVVGLVVGGAWMLAHLPAFGDPQAMPHQYISPTYLARSLEDTQTPNVVTAVLADYRGFDTLMETAVIFTAAMACWLLGWSPTGRGRGPMTGSDRGHRHD